MLFGGAHRRKPRAILLAALVAYGLVLAVTPVLHHDLECHWRTPGHCVACIATPAAVDAANAAPDASPAFVDVGGVEHQTPAAPETPLHADSHGRSPPL